MPRNMKTVVITSQKGGSGKTTLAAHFAIAVERAGNGPAVVIDTDPQQTLATWWNEREAETPKLAPVSIRELPEKIEALDKAGFTYCFIDTPPALTEQNRQVLALADLIVIPTRPSPNDLWSLGATLDLIKGSNIPFVFVLTQAKANARITVQTMAALSQHGQVFPSIVHDRVDYAAAMTDGRTAQEISPGGPCAVEMAELWEATKKRIGELAKLREPASEKRVKVHA
ncbi:MAG TPA: ParA family protein [Bryobacteraceae bacterium]|nr:ParA family protein [Bryobacteraceae bacterium]